MPPVTDHDTLLLHFKSILEDGSVFEDSTAGEPQKITVGAGMINPLFEEALLGKEPGETVSVILPPEKAYGTYKKRLVFPIKRKRLNLNKEPEVGETIALEVKGVKGTVQIIEVTPTKLVVDGNHPLAGQTITYEITIVDNLGHEPAE